MSDILAKLLRPRVVSVKEESVNKAQIVIEPLERGFGHTLGNAFRRLLLSSIPGYAITDVQIDGVAHEFSSIENVKEDVVEIILNLKGIAISVVGREEEELEMGPRRLAGPRVLGPLPGRLRGQHGTHQHR